VSEPLLSPLEADLALAYLRRDGEPERPPAGEPSDAVEAIRRAILDDGQEVGRSGQEAREPISGTNDLLKRAAAHMIFGSRESGKTFVMLLAAIAAANAGERVLYLDLENGEPEMRERLEAILDATDWPNPLDSGALRIVSFPTLSRSWKPEDWAAAMGAWALDGRRVALKGRRQSGLRDHPPGGSRIRPKGGTPRGCADPCPGGCPGAT
jgi:AAA domain